MRLKKPCIHDCYDRHWPNLFEAVVCPGGEFLPEGALIDLVNEQAEDEGLWFMARTAPEAYLQQELRRLHALIEATLT